MKNNDKKGQYGLWRNSAIIPHVVLPADHFLSSVSGSFYTGGLNAGKQAFSPWASVSSAPASQTDFPSVLCTLCVCEAPITYTPSTVYMYCTLLYVVWITVRKEPVSLALTTSFVDKKGQKLVLSWSFVVCWKSSILLIYFAFIIVFFLFIIFSTMVAVLQLRALYVYM